MKINKILILGSGALKIGEAGEFDYSGTQALKSFKEEGVFTILINPNIATVQTSEEIANKVYFLPITTYFVESVIKKEKPDGIIISFGGQTALNCGIDLFKLGIIDKYKIKILGTSIKSIINSEDRDIFKKILFKHKIKSAKSIAINSLDEITTVSKKIGFPVIVRSAYSLGGLGSGFANNITELKDLSFKSFSYTNQILIEESLKGWKEIEYEIVRDSFGNCIAVCNMENFDPIGIHTGESIVIAPSQTLNNFEYYNLRKISINIANIFNIIGECNVQFALSPFSYDYRVIEINARLSRSSALASKATGYPLAFIAAKLALGYGLHQLKNVVTKTTSAFFEPSLDYVVCKFPRWDLKKFHGVSREIGSSMKSIGEVMSIGCSFEEAFQKGIRMLEIGLEGFINNKIKNKSINYKTIENLLKNPTDTRIQIIELAFEYGFSVKDINNLTKIDFWFLYKLENLYNTKKILLSHKHWKEISKENLLKAKKEGFSDKQILSFYSLNNEKNIDLLRNHRKSLNIIPFIRQIDTLSGEYPTKTNYLYITYNSNYNDIINKNNNSIVVLGSGVYRIGSSVEFDWCCVNTLKTIQNCGYKAIMINCNPETVSTDFDVCDRLYFEELSLERILDILEYEKPIGLIISMGGQTPNNLAKMLHKKGVNILGTSAISIDKIENRYKFSKILDLLEIKQPKWKEVSNFKTASDFIEKEIGYPVLIRPSYVLSGSSMMIVFNSKDLKHYIKKVKNISSEYPIVVTEFIENAKEIEFDAVSNKGKILHCAISEHVEYAGVHSGDATLIYPPQNIYISTLKLMYKISKKISQYFKISGPFNVQFLLKNNNIKVIECNLRASRSFPFISKISNFNMIDLATKILLNKPYLKVKNIFKNIFNIDYIGVKASQFSFSRLKGADPILGVDMSSTGEVGCLGNSIHDAIIKAMLSVGYKIPKKNILLSGGTLYSKNDLLESIKILNNNGYKLFATEEMHDYLLKYNIKTICLNQSNDKKNYKIIDFLEHKKIELVINIPKKISMNKFDNDYLIRRAAIDFNIPLLTNTRLTNIFVKSFCELSINKIDTSDISYYLK